LDFPHVCGRAIDRAHIQYEIIAYGKSRIVTDCYKTVENPTIKPQYPLPNQQKKARSVAQRKAETMARDRFAHSRAAQMIRSQGAETAYGSFHGRTPRLTVGQSRWLGFLRKAKPKRKQAPSSKDEQRKLAAKAFQAWKSNHSPKA